MNGGAGLRDCFRVATFVTSRLQRPQHRGVDVGGVAVAVGSPSPIRAACRRSGRAPRRSVSPAAVARIASSVQYSRAVNASISRSRSTTRRTATDWTRPADRPDADLPRQQRAQRVADEPVDDPAGLLGVDEVRVDVARMGERLADRALGDLAEGHPLGLRRRDVGGLRDVPGDRLALAVEVGGEVDGVGGLRGLRDLGDLLAAVVGDDVLGGEVVLDVDAELALAGVLRQVADVAVGGEDAVVGAQVALDRPRLGRRLDDHEVLWHGRECSTGFCTAAHPAIAG